MSTIPIFSRPLPGAGGSLNIRRAAASVGTGGHWFCGEVLGPWENAGEGCAGGGMEGPMRPRVGCPRPDQGLR